METGFASAIQKDPSQSDGPQWRGGIALRLLVTIALSVSVAEFIVMTVILPNLPQLSTLGEGLVDTILLSIFVSPVLYFFHFRPLQSRLVEEQAAKAELHRVGLSLRQTVQSLEVKDRDSATLREMDDLLQSLRTFEEAYRVIKGAGERLFPATSGGVMLMAHSRNTSQLVARWGEAEPVCLPEFGNPDNCLALRMGHVHQVGGESLSIACSNVTDASLSNYACVPLLAQGEALGVMYLVCDHPIEAGDTAKLVTISRRIALAFANLRLNETLLRQSVTDPLTGLYNRRYLQATLEREIHRAERRGIPVSVLMIDVDHFKQFNDDFGHEVGDIVLRELAALLRRCARIEDIVARYGGEEFIIVMPEASLEIAHNRAELIRLQTEALKVTHRGQGVRPFTVSEGIAAFPDHGKMIDEVIKAADMALYEAKAAGRNRVMAPKLPS